MTDDRPAGDGSAAAAAGAGEAAAAHDAADSGPTRGEEPVGDGEAAGDDRSEDAPAPQVIRRRGRRVSTEPSPGYTGEPPTERKQSSENDARIWGDLPPHWGKR
ncbi:hypothetical protein SAMN04487783_0491 [Agrococcus baldri]|uniref:Uncharacterized protein n=1 Tax=Agrococcus baldri TaxID=153730 RepID=A0AA94HKL2_9MICO|nr:hypothetical protein [Agrococcus baldri]SFS00844.1 hypothetical protein SAMN04487783_0491 [Agrococcus baldri]